MGIGILRSQIPVTTHPDEAVVAVEQAARTDRQADRQMAADVK